ncbi:hypothetical protein F4678DRAFT_452367 [Xylaria arbuscula]|nr:hypothetical protein F4678DRAFT_452367 [Xylaria arbuscula]
MASFALIGLASNILQFAQLGTQLVLQARELYKSASGSTVSHAQVEADTEALKSLMKHIQIKVSVTGAPGRTKAERQLSESAKSCADMADKLLELLDASKLKGTSSSRLRAIKQEFYNESTREQVTHLQKRLQELQGATVLHFTAVLRDNQSTIYESIKDLTLTNQRLEARTTSKLDSIHQNLIQRQIRAEQEVKEMTSLIKAMHIETRNACKQLALLKSLEVKTRREAIKEAHAKTFEWILGQHQFANWLKGGKGIYWIRGKAGTPIQKSLTGLLRTLLFQILRQIPDLIEKVFPIRWGNGQHANLDTWSENELFQAISVLPLDDCLPVRFCFFIDGLDEYTTGSDRYHGDYQELINSLEVLSASPVIKVCVSSRPWTPFERAFGGSLNKLRLEDSTYDDIRSYVLDKFRRSKYFQKLAEIDPRCSLFGEQIVQKAQGVFLWVFLVVESLLKGVSAADDFDDLQRRLDSMPGDLEDYFKHMLETIDPFYWEQTMRIFQLTVDADQPLPLLGYELLNRERLEPDYALQLTYDECFNLDSPTARERSQEQLNVRCRDLLEVVRDRNEDFFMSYRVEYLHRTVRDFFVENNFLVEMIKKRKINFDSQVSLCQIMLGLVKILVASRLGVYNSGQKSDLVDKLMHYVHVIETNLIDSERSISELKENRRFITVHDLLDELNRFTVLVKANDGTPWTNKRNDQKRTNKGHLEKTVLVPAIEARLLLYVTAKLDANPQSIQQRGGRPLLYYALRLRALNPRKMTNSNEDPDVPLVELLLLRGADPNVSVYNSEGRRSLWTLFLERYAQYAKETHPKKRSPSFYKTLCLMIENGADWRQFYLRGEGGADKAYIHQLGLADREIDDLNAVVEMKKVENSIFAWLPASWGWYIMAWLLAFRGWKGYRTRNVSRPARR